VTEALIAYYLGWNKGLAPERWRAQLEEIRALPELERPQGGG
jgi:hypothetical protein